ncbi:MAG: hypothetical protein ACM3JJ_11560 [Hyphomicrobiales bacterium]
MTIIFLVLLAAACGGGWASSSVSPSLPVVHANEAQDGHTLTLRRGQRLQVVLHSTYWKLARVSRTTVLRTVAKPVVRPRSGCVPGAGCGTVTAVYVGVAAGTANVSASRTSCGEAMGCTAAAGRYVLRVVVR